MTGRTLTGYRHELVIYRRTTPVGKALAWIVGAVLAAVAVGLGF